MLITNDEWKTVKTKSKNNTNIASPRSVSSKNPLPVNLQNRFNNLIITEANQIEILESQNYIRTNHHKRCEIASLHQRQKKIIPTTFVHLMQ